MTFLDRFLKRSCVIGAIAIRDVPAHRSFMATLTFTKVSSESAPFPADDPGAPFHKCDYSVTIKKVADPEILPLVFEVKAPTGFYHLLLRVALAREIHGKLNVQIENFTMSAGPLELRHDRTVTLNGSFTWPQVSDDDVHNYGLLKELADGDT
jgi:hypothetical protein